MIRARILNKKFQKFSKYQRYEYNTHMHTPTKYIINKLLKVKEIASYQRMKNQNCSRMLGITIKIQWICMHKLYNLKDMELYFKVLERK